MVRALLSLTVASAVYGFTLGSAHCMIYATRNLIKFPMLVLGTTVICGLAYFIFYRFITAELTFFKVQGLVVNLFRDMAILLASLSPANFFIAQILVHTDDKQIGEYSFFLGLNVVFIAVSGTIALVRQSQRLFATCSLSRRLATTTILGWLLLSLLVGGQLAFYLRPFFGLPASRGVVPPFALGAEADVRGATNFYEAVIQVVTEPPLPDHWRSRSYRD